MCIRDRSCTDDLYVIRNKDVDLSLIHIYSTQCGSFQVMAHIWKYVPLVSSFSERLILKMKLLLVLLLMILLLFHRRMGKVQSPGNQYGDWRPWRCLVHLFQVSKCCRLTREWIGLEMELREFMPESVLIQSISYFCIYTVGPVSYTHLDVYKRQHTHIEDT